MISSVITQPNIPTMYDLFSSFPTTNLVTPFPTNFNPYQIQGNLLAIDRSSQGKGPLIVFGLVSFTAEESALVNDPTRGQIIGVNGDTMQVEWKAYTTSDQNTLTHPHPLQGGGVGVWASPAVDTIRNLLYIGTGDFHTPPPIYTGKPTDNTPDYSDSLLAINYNTGQIVDHVQLTKGDMQNGCYSPGSPVCDPTVQPPPVIYTLLGIPLVVNWNVYLTYVAHSVDILGRPPNLYQTTVNDIGSAPQLFTINVKGKNVDVVGINDKDGTYFVFDRKNLNKLYWAQPSIAFQHGNTPFDYNIGGGTIGGAAIDYAHHLIWESTWGIIDTNFNAASYIQAMDMNTGKIMASILPAQFTSSDTINGTVIANNVLYAVGGNGNLYLFDISGCGNASCNPPLLFEDQIQAFPDGSGLAPIARNVAVAYGKIFINVGEFFGPPYGGLEIYNLKLPALPH